MASSNAMFDRSDAMFGKSNATATFDKVMEEKRKQQAEMEEKRKQQAEQKSLERNKSLDVEISTNQNIRNEGAHRKSRNAGDDQASQQNARIGSNPKFFKEDRVGGNFLKEDRFGGNFVPAVALQKNAAKKAALHAIGNNLSKIEQDLRKTATVSHGADSFTAQKQGSTPGQPQIYDKAIQQSVATSRDAGPLPNTPGQPHMQEVFDKAVFDKAYNKAYQTLSEMAGDKQRLSEEALEKAKQRNTKINNKLKEQSQSNEKLRKEIDEKQQEFEKLQQQFSEQQEKHEFDRQDFAQQMRESNEQYQTLYDAMQQANSTHGYELQQQKERGKKKRQQYRDVRARILNVNNKDDFTALKQDMQKQEEKRNKKREQIGLVRDRIKGLREFQEGLIDGTPLNPNVSDKLPDLGEAFDAKYPKGQSDFDTDSEGDVPFSNDLDSMDNALFSIPGTNPELFSMLNDIAKPFRHGPVPLTPDKAEKYLRFIEALERSQAFKSLIATGDPQQLAKSTLQVIRKGVMGNIPKKKNAGDASSESSEGDVDYDATMSKATPSKKGDGAGSEIGKNIEALDQYGAAPSGDEEQSQAKSLAALAAKMLDDKDKGAKMPGGNAESAEKIIASDSAPMPGDKAGFVKKTIVPHSAPEDSGA